MVASKVVITAETRAKLDNPILTPAKQRALREEMIKEYIRNSVNGEATKQQLIAAAGYNPDARSNEYARGVAMLGSMMNRGLIKHDGTKTFKKVWTVLGDIKTRPLAEPTPTTEPAEMIVPKEVMVELKEFNLTNIKLVDMAKEFSWRENTDSLREFISYVENAIK